MTISENAGRTTPPRPGPLARYFARFDEGEVIRWAFRGLLIGAIGVLAFDFNDLVKANPFVSRDAPGEVGAPILPPAVRDDPGQSHGSRDPRGNVTADEDGLRAPLAFTLQAGGVLAVNGYVDVGAAARFAAELSARGEYVTTVSLNSPGGALDDAIEISRLIRERELATDVADGAFCASSCPLMLAGGAVRSVGPKAAVGVHQFYAVSGEASEPAQAMSDAQATTARISRHLITMGVDPSLWLHAMDTPPRSLYYLSAEEMRGFRLTTTASAVASQ